ncbi:MAG: response regulator [Dehalococcoidales bacterium]|nr:response regulator [Dehalococcoidales bacterium]
MAIKTDNKILLVQNEVMARACLNNRLKSKGYQCDEVANTNQVLYKLANSEFDLVFLDIELPGMSAVELLPEIKDDYPNTAIIVTTPIGCTDVGMECIKLGAHEYITKPLITEEIVRVIGIVLEKRRLELVNKGLLKCLENKIIEQANELHNVFLNALTSLAYALEAKDKYTNGHSRRVAMLSVAIAKEMGIPQSVIEKIKLAAQVHDIGKIGVSESILNKPVRLTDEEFRHIQEHSAIGEHILTPIIDDKETLSMVRNHHEHCDGSGYPDHLENTQMSAGIRIIAVADAYDAMTSDRAYRTALSNEIAFHELKRGIGTQFDSEVVSALRCLNN